MTKLLLLLTTLFINACTTMEPTHGTTLLHEKSESRLMTEQEFESRAVQSADLIFEGMFAISEAADRYALDNDGSLPTGAEKAIRSLLLDGGYLKAWPVIPPFAFTDPVQNELRYIYSYDNMDGTGAMEDVIIAPDLKIEVCEAFIQRYASAGLGNTIYDYEANRSKYPGEVFGRHIKVYAINWSSVNSAGSDVEPSIYCELQWVMQYND